MKRQAALSGALIAYQTALNINPNNIRYLALSNPSFFDAMCPDLLGEDLSQRLFFTTNTK